MSNENLHDLPKFPQASSQRQGAPSGPEIIRTLADTGLAANEWVLKMVQAAVAAGCSQLHFKFNQRTTVVVFTRPDPAELENVANTLFHPERPVSAFAEQLNPGLRSLLRWHRFSLEGHDGTRLEWDGRRLNRSTGLRRESLRLLVETPPRGSTGERRRGIIDSERLLSRRAVYAPLELFIDGRKVSPETTPANRRIPGHRRVRSETLLLVYQDEGGTCAAGTSWRLPPNRVFQDRLRSEAPFLSVGGSGGEPSARHFELLVDLDRLRQRSDKTELPGGPDPSPNQLFLEFSRLGVICETWTLPSPSPAIYHRPVHQAEIDSGGLTLTVSDELGEQTLAELSQLEGSLRNLEDLLLGREPAIDLARRELPAHAVTSAAGPSVLTFFGLFLGSAFRGDRVKGSPRGKSRFRPSTSPGSEPTRAGLKEVGDPRSLGQKVHDMVAQFRTSLEEFKARPKERLSQL